MSPGDECLTKLTWGINILHGIVMPPGDIPTSPNSPVPCSHTAAYNMMANLRLKMVREHLTVVLRAPQDLSERNFDHVLYKLRAAPATNSPSNPRTTPLQLGPVEVVGIYTLKPPAQDKQNTDGDAPQKPPTLWERFKQTASGIMIRVYFRLFCYSCVRWGFSVPSMMFSWMGNIHSMSPHITASEIYDPKQWGLETMCIANALQGQGVGRAVVKHMQAELSKSRAPGMHGLCQSEHTKEFYVKCGFKGREVFTHQDPSPYKPGAYHYSNLCADLTVIGLLRHVDEMGWVANRQGLGRGRG